MFKSSFGLKLIIIHTYNLSNWYQNAPAVTVGCIICYGSLKLTNYLSERNIKMEIIQYLCLMPSARRQLKFHDNDQGSAGRWEESGGIYLRNHGKL